MRIFSLAYFLQGLLFFLFFYFGDGLIFFDEQSDFYKSVKLLQSSGSDDDIAIWVLGLISLMVSLMLVVKKNTITRVVIAVCIASFFQLLALLLIEVGSISLTLIIGKDLYLIGAVLCQIWIFIMLAVKGFTVVKKNIVR